MPPGISVLCEKANKPVWSKNKKIITSKSRVQLVWAGCPQGEPSTKCSIKESLPRRKNALSQAHRSESSTLRRSWPIKCSFFSPWPFLGREQGWGVRWKLHLCLLIKEINSLFGKLSGESIKPISSALQTSDLTEFFTFMFVSEPGKYSLIHLYSPSKTLYLTLHARVAFVLQRSLRNGRDNEELLSLLRDTVSEKEIKPSDYCSKWQKKERSRIHLSTGGCSHFCGILTLEEDPQASSSERPHWINSTDSCVSKMHFACVLCSLFFRADLFLMIFYCNLGSCCIKWYVASNGMFLKNIP